MLCLSLRFRLNSYAPTAYYSRLGNSIREDGEICACPNLDSTVSHIKHRINIFQKHISQNTNPVPGSPRLYRSIAILTIQLLPQQIRCRDPKERPPNLKVDVLLARVGARRGVAPKGIHSVLRVVLSARKGRVNMVAISLGEDYESGAGVEDDTCSRGVLGGCADADGGDVDFPPDLLDEAGGCEGSADDGRVVPSKGPFPAVAATGFGFLVELDAEHVLLEESVSPHILHYCFRS